MTEIYLDTNNKFKTKIAGMNLSGIFPIIFDRILDKELKEKKIKEREIPHPEG